MKVIILLYPPVFLLNIKHLSSFVSLADAQSHFTESNLLDKCTVASNILF